MQDNLLLMRLFCWWCLFLVIAGQQVSAQQTDTLPSTPATVRTFPPLRQYYAPVSLLLAGIFVNGHGSEAIKYELVEERNEHIPHFHTRIDNYLQFSPIAIAYGLDAAGIKSRTDFANRTAILLKGEILMTSTVFLLKYTTHELRPDGSTYNSFPSGHTAQAFAAATFLSEEYKHRFPWMPYAAYGIAGSVGLLRMANNRHYISDVLVGAGMGILSMKMAYWTHRYRWNKHRKVPQPVPGQ
ncbi:phosphatase PAP2 family protein [Chitinophaga pendula]|uniref:phosphatase PAP2 family protein n=1 Tax=Chitinophaga TaxID=79328 RepID=UPI000BAF6405|nr:MULTISPECIES: phosphatase PAP2 family protein [Chitinophaga]ASZ12688.1 phospholipid phosphatase [Chitinophaga sp. MD30]UCJ09700.1 phosphatase PAP2 family protein [Chitinophaga pendula]